MSHMATTQLWSATSVAKSAAVTSAAVDVSKAIRASLNILVLTGVNPDFTYTYSLSNSREGTYVEPTTLATGTDWEDLTAVDILDFVPEASRFIKIIATSNNAVNAVALTAQLSVQE